MATNSYGFSGDPAPAADNRTRQMASNVPQQQNSLYGFSGKPRDEIAEYVEMLRWDAQARQAVSFFSNLVLGLIGEYTHEDPRIQTFVRQSLQLMRGDWSAALRWLLRAPVIGFSLSEKVWKPARVDGKQGWIYETLCPIAPVSVIRQGIAMDSVTGHPAEVVQWRGQTGQVSIPGEKLIHWAYEDLGDGYGTGLGQCMLPLYRGKAEAMKMWLTGIKRLGQPYIYERVPVGEAALGLTGGPDKTIIDAIADDWARAAGGSVILRAVSEADAANNLPDIEVLRADNFDQEFIHYVDYVNRAYFLALGIPALVVMESQGTAQAQSTVHSDAARFAALPMAKEFVDGCLVSDVVQPLVETNFGAQDDYGTFPCSIPINEAYVASLLGSLAQAGVTGMMVDYRIYMKLQGLFPQLLPAVEEAEYGADAQAPPPTATKSAPIAVPGGAAPESVKDLPGTPAASSGMDQAKSLISEQLVKWPRRGSELYALGKAAGISEDTMRRASKELGVKVYQKDGFYWWAIVVK